MLASFREKFQADKQATVASAELISAYSDKVPASLLELWKTSGLGNYNQGIIEFIDPRDYEDNLWTWLGKEVANYMPFAITAYGELFYYRKLEEGQEDVCLLDIQYRDIQVLTWGMNDFFETFLTDEQSCETWLRATLFSEAVQQDGPLKAGEIFSFVPVLAFGGVEAVSSLKKANAAVYQQIVFDLTS